MPTGYETERGVAVPVPAIGEVCSGLRVKLFGRGRFQRVRHLFHAQREERTVARVNQRRTEGHIYRILRGPRSVKVSRARSLLTGKLWE
jgi:hypothetical protein